MVVLVMEEMFKPSIFNLQLAMGLSLRTINKHLVELQLH